MVWGQGGLSDLGVSVSSATWAGDRNTLGGYLPVAGYGSHQREGGVQGTPAQVSMRADSDTGVRIKERRVHK